MLISAAAHRLAMDEIEIVELPAQTVVGLKRRGNFSEISIFIPAMLGEVCTLILEKGGIPIGPPVALYPETLAGDAGQATEPGELELEVAFPVANRVKTEGEIAYYDLSGGRFAKAVHHGPYEEMPPVYERLFAWIAERDLRIVGPIREAYLNDPHEVEPGEILTEIYVPIA